MTKFRVAVAIALLGFCITPLLSRAETEAPPIDSSLKPADVDDEAVANVFRDMGVVQHKAMNKSQKILFAPYFSMDFSDGPYSMYSINTDLGYALSDFWEVYVNFVPKFINNKRTLTKKIENFTLLSGNQAEVTEALPKSQYGVEVLWAPLYGKDSLGIHSIVRSDTFFKFGVSQINYDLGSGMKFHLGVGKTYFLSKRAGLRFTVSGNYLQTIVDSAKSYNLVAMIEAGFVFYMF